MLRMLSFLLSVKYKKLPKVWAWKEHNQVQNPKFSDYGAGNGVGRSLLANEKAAKNQTEGDGGLDCGWGQG